jgi:hypothetical protein
LLDSFRFVSRAATAAWLRSFLVTLPRKVPARCAAERERAIQLLALLLRPEDAPIFRAVVLDPTEEWYTRRSARAALYLLGERLDAVEVQSFLARCQPDEPFEELLPIVDDDGRALLDDAFRAVESMERFERFGRSSAGLSMVRDWMVERLPTLADVPRKSLAIAIARLSGTSRVHEGALELRARLSRGEDVARLTVSLLGPATRIGGLLEVARDHACVMRCAVDHLALPVAVLVDHLGEDGLKARVRTTLLADEPSHMSLLGAFAVLEQWEEGPELALDLLRTPDRPHVDAIVRRVLPLKRDWLTSHALDLLEAEADLPLVTEIVRRVAMDPRPTDGALLRRAVRIPALRREAFDGLERVDESWLTDALELAGDDPVLRARVIARRATLGDASAIAALAERAVNGPGPARIVALRAWITLAPDPRELLRSTLVGPTPPTCDHGCCDGLAELAARQLAIEPTDEDMTLLIRTFLGGAGSICDAVARGLSRRP